MRTDRTRRTERGNHGIAEIARQGDCLVSRLDLRQPEVTAQRGRLMLVDDKDIDVPQRRGSDRGAPVPG